MTRGNLSMRGTVAVVLYCLAAVVPAAFVSATERAFGDYLLFIGVIGALGGAVSFVLAASRGERTAALVAGLVAGVGSSLGAAYSLSRGEGFMRWEVAFWVLVGALPGLLLWAILLLSRKASWERDR